MNDLKIIKNYSGNSISIEELSTFLDRNLDFNNYESLIEASTQFGRLYLNKNLIKDHIYSSLRNGLSFFEYNNNYTPPSIILHSSERYFLRANLWRRVDKIDNFDINVYGLPHDHNFNFLTLNYFGPGYISKMYTYNYEKVSGNIGEKVEIIDNGILSLNEGDMYFYRKNYDIHCQLPPISDSITINLMEKVNVKKQTMQYIFDINSSLISKVYGGFYAKKQIFEMAALLNDSECNDLLNYIKINTNCNKSKVFLKSLLNHNNN